MLPCRYTAALLAIGILVGSPAARADDPGDESWVEESRGAGWVLYTRDVPGSDFPGFRLVGQTDEPIEKVIAALQRKLHDDRYLAKDYRRTVLASGDDYLLTHLYFDVPIYSDRVLVVETSWHTDPDTGVHRVVWRPADVDRPDLDQGAVPMISEGSWEITPLVNGGTQLVYEQHTDLGGWVPRWLIARQMNPEVINEMTTLYAILDEELPAVASGPRPSAGQQPPDRRDLLAQQVENVVESQDPDQDAGLVDHR